jgi:hypothetical protein
MSNRPDHYNRAGRRASERSPGWEGSSAHSGRPGLGRFGGPRSSRHGAACSALFSSVLPCLAIACGQSITSISTVSAAQAAEPRSRTFANALQDSAFPGLVPSRPCLRDLLEHQPRHALSSQSSSVATSTNNLGQVAGVIQRSETMRSPGIIFSSEIREIHSCRN